MADFDVVIVGGGAAGISTAASLQARDRALNIAIVEPSDVHYYQPGWTMVGGGIFNASDTVEPTARVMPKGVNWVKQSVVRFDPKKDSLVLSDKSRLSYKYLVVCPGLKLNWAAVEGLEETLGRNGVTSNYRFDLAPYTWQLVQSLKGGKAIFTQPPMPIKCAGAPQKAMYLSADHWRSKNRLANIDVEFCNAGGVLFGVADYVPALMEYVNAYGVQLSFSHNLVKIDGAARKAWFDVTEGNKTKQVAKDFDMIHICPPQIAPDFIRKSALCDAAGWFDVDIATLQHVAYENIYGLGDATNTPNAKTAAAVRKQAPVVATNIVNSSRGKSRSAIYDGYGSCPLTVERGRIVLAEFGYGGKLLPTFPSWVLQGLRPTWAAWALKAHILPALYWRAMLKGREWLARPEMR